MADGVPTRTQILEASGDMLKWQVYVVHTYPANGLGPVMENIGPHLAHQAKMEAEGIFVAAGPHWEDDEETWGGEGMFVVRARDLAHAKEIAAADPMHTSGAREYRVRPWLINEGTITVKVNFASGTREVM